MKNRTRVGAYGVVVREDEILLCRISSFLPHLKGQWTLPGGGIEFAEHPEVAVVREVEEETGLIVEVTGLATVDSICSQTSDGEMHHIRVVYYTQVLGGELRNEIDGTTDLCQWCPLAEVAQLPLTTLATLGVSLAWTQGELF